MVPSPLLPGNPVTGATSMVPVSEGVMATTGMWVGSLDSENHDYRIEEIACVTYLVR